jgi:hypothetical protein
MKRVLGIAVVLVFMVSVFAPCVFSEDSGKACGIEQVESLGGGEYMADSGEIIEMEDIGGGSKMSSDGEIFQDYGTGDGELATSTGGLVQVDE